MTYNPSFNLSQTNNPQDHPRHNNYRPSVPISVYRELAAELQATQEKLMAVQSENQALVEHNQKLRREIDRIAHQGQKLQELVSTVVFMPNYPDPSTTNLELTSPLESKDEQSVSPIVSPTPKKTVKKKERVKTSAAKPQTFREIPETNQNQLYSPPSKAKMSGTCLAIAIFFIILTSFATGFLLLRPYFTGNSR